MRSSAIVAVLVLLAGCPTSGGECTYDEDCLSGDVCANTHDCRAPASVHFVSVHWTIGGAEASAGACAGMDDLAITVEDSETPDYRTSWFPVPCASGRFTVDKLPVEYDRASVTVDATGERWSASIPAEGGDVFVDLAPRDGAN